MKTRLAVIAVLALAFAQGRAYAEVMCPGANEVERALCKEIKASRQRAESIPQIPAPTRAPAAAAAPNGVCERDFFYPGLGREHCEQTLAETGVAGIKGCTEDDDTVDFCILALQVPEVRAAGMVEAKVFDVDDDYGLVLSGYVRLANRRVITLKGLHYQSNDQRFMYYR